MNPLYGVVDGAQVHAVNANRVIHFDDGEEDRN
jgi:hypothetical protein